MKYPSCEERIDKSLKSVVRDFQKALKTEKDIISWLNNYALCLTKKEVYKLELSWGGPQTYVEFEYDPESEELTRITYYFLDWFDGAKREVVYGTKEWKILEEFFRETILTY